MHLCSEQMHDTQLPQLASAVVWSVSSDPHFGGKVTLLVIKNMALLV
jgi:hypothetical protein